MTQAACEPRLTATIDLDAIAHNLARVRTLAPDARVMAAVKAEAYGHGAVPVARALQRAGVDALAVACLEEALQLRAAGLRTPIVLLEGALSPGEARVAVDEGFSMVMHAPWQLELLRQLPGDGLLHLWVQIDSGMHRLGFPPDEARAVYAALQALPRVMLCGWMTHLACADDPQSPMTQRQVALFENAVSGLPGDRSVANSAGLIDVPAAHDEWVRPGLMLYGASPFAARSAAALDLQPAMQLDSRIIALHDIAAGETVGYGGTWRAERPTRIAVVAAGYADGIHRALPSGTPVCLKDRRVPMVGRVSMDMITLDVTGVAGVRVGDAVTLWGGPLPVEEVAAKAGTIAYELFCGLSHRVRYRYLGEGL